MTTTQPAMQTHDTIQGGWPVTLGASTAGTAHIEMDCNVE